ncbi:MAG: UDP-N-acetylmuramoyl-L-alanine--D-glutamate ligase [Clostridiales bacterium]|nr:UDP-N-acetylmuramoyl-L-alanine--D-glutamate ligase [Clostridiales bacterium]
MWRGKRVYLIGAGKSGLAASNWLLSQGAELCLNDRKPFEAFAEDSQKELTALESRGLTLELGAEPNVEGWGAAYVIASPGVPLTLPALRQAAEQGIPVTNEIELGWQIRRPQVIGVTGSNGKTTVTSLIGQIMDDAGLAFFMGGNIGTPFIQAAPAMKETDWALLELSSFQLAGILSTAPKIAMILNLSPDHLDWHQSFDHYVESKWRIAAFQGPEDRLILNYDDLLLREEGNRRLREGKAYLPGGMRVQGPALWWFSRKEEPEGGVYIDREGWVAYPSRSAEGGGMIRIRPVREFALPGKHNLENLLAALSAGLALGIAPGTLRRSAASFRAIEHRIEELGEYEGVLYVNDSKATNPDSAIKAMDAYDRPILLIAGGDGKGVPFDGVAETFVKKGRFAALLGKDRNRIKEALQTCGFSHFQMVGSIEEAVEACHAQAKPGDLVLLSPACSSLDMFGSYEERGRAFKEAVRSLTPSAYRDGEGGHNGEKE